MASSSGAGGRSPKDLRDLVNSNKHDKLEFSDDMKANLEKLRALSKDDLSENGLLRSRIDQQCELICILKQRADESLKKSMNHEKENSELKKHSDEILSALHNETRKYSVLEKRFFVLNQNHEELIAIKDDYKAENEKLRLDNNRLKKENEGLFGGMIQERDLQIQQLREEVGNLQLMHEAASAKERIAAEDLSSVQRKYGEQAEKLQKEISLLKEKAEASQKKFEEKFEKSTLLEEESKTRVSLLIKERDQFANLALERGRALEDKQNEIKRLSLKLDEAERSLKETEDKFVSELQTMSVNAQVQRLKKKVDEAERKHQESAKEYDAYKRHMTTLLGKEKELNNKLRVLIG